MKTIIISGVGGQGIVTASDYLSNVLMESGFEIKKSEVLGMSQRGGDVISTIKFGEKVFSPMPSLYSADYIVSFEKLEALRNINYLSKNGMIIVNDYVWEPLPVSAGLDVYPSHIEEDLKKYTDKVVVIPATKIAQELGNIKVTNVVLMGVLASKMSINKAIWLDKLKERVPLKFIDLNLQAFERGYNF